MNSFKLTRQINWKLDSNNGNRCETSTYLHSNHLGQRVEAVGLVDHLSVTSFVPASLATQNTDWTCAKNTIQFAADEYFSFTTPAVWTATKLRTRYVMKYTQQQNNNVSSLSLNCPVISEWPWTSNANKFHIVSPTTWKLRGLLNCWS